MTTTDEANTVEAADSFANEVAIEVCTSCDRIFDLQNGFGWAIDRWTAKIEFFCARCREAWSRVSEETHHFIEWVEEGATEAAVRGE